MGAESELALTFLGQFRAWRHGQVLTRFESDKVRALLAFLAVERQSVHSRSALAALLWPGFNEDSARVNLRHTLHQLRVVLGEKESETPALIVTRQTVQFQPAFDAEIDVERFTALLAKVRAHAHADLFSCAPCRENLLKVIALYNGEFLSNLSLADCAPFEEWRRVKQEQLHIALSDALHTLAEISLSAQRYEEALAYARRQIELEPWREDAHRQIMRAFAASGQRDAAMAQYALLRKTLAAEIGVAPSPETVAFYEQIKFGRLDAQPASRAQPAAAKKHDWGDIPAADVFHGREKELAQLQKWLVQDRCRFVSILGIGGIGKTTLAAAAARAVAADFELVIWRSLLNAPPLDEILRSWLQTLSKHALAVLPDSLDEQLHLLLSYLRQRRCLMVLDNVESVLQTGSGERHATGEARPGYEPYAILFARLADSEHNSCLLITSREQPHAPGTYSGMNIHGATGLNDVQRATLLTLGAIAEPPHPARTSNNDAEAVAHAAPAQNERMLSNLPADTTPFVGREAERQSICHLLQSNTTRLLTLIGPGGAGKTRLALACGRALSGAFEHGAHFVALDALPAEADAERVAAEIGRALNLESSERDTLRHLAQALQNRHALLILDNFEHLLTDDAPAIQVVLRLLETSPRLQMLVTSRTRLNIRAETLHPIEGLSTTVAPGASTTGRSDAADFFVQCARRQHSMYSPSPKDLDGIQAICELLHGMPLALEMAATHTDGRAIQNIADELFASLTSLSADWRDAPPRHRSMRAVFMWSWQLLDDRLRDVLQRLAVFRGGFTTDAAQAVAGATRADLARLADGSLLVAARPANGADRLDVHVMVAGFAMEQLIAAQALDAAQASHAEYFLGMARQAEAALSGLSAEGDLEWTRRLQIDHENILLGLERLESTGRLDEALDLCARMYPFWNTRGYYQAGARWLRRLLDAAHAAVLNDQRAPGASHARALIALAHMSIDRGENIAARPLLNDALAIATRLGDSSIRARALLFLGVLNGREGAAEVAMAQLSESFETSQRLGEQYSSALALNYIGALEAASGRLERARASFRSCVQLLESMRIECDRVFALRQCGHLALQAGDLSDAAACYAQSVSISFKIVENNVPGAYIGLTCSIAGCAALLAERGDDGNALLLCSAVQRIERHNASEMWPADRERFQRTNAALMQRLGHSAAAAAGALAESLSVQQIVNLCRELA